MQRECLAGGKLGRERQLELMVMCIVKNLVLALLIQSRLRDVLSWKGENKEQGNEMTVISPRSSGDISVAHMSPVPLYVATQCLPPSLFKCLRTAVNSPDTVIQQYKRVLAV